MIMKLYLYLCIIVYMIIVVIASIQYNQRCTFSSGTCNWNIGRRWQVRNIDDETDDKVVVAIDGSHTDKELGFTDTITSPWLYLTSFCSYNVRLVFQFSIENDQDQIEVFLIKKNQPQISSLRHWKARRYANNETTDDTESFWQQANVSFQAAAEFRVEIEIRHLPDKNNYSTTWFAIDDILIESCPNVRKTTTCPTHHINPAKPSWPKRASLNTSNSSLLTRSLFRFRWKLNNSLSDTTDTIAPEESSPRRFTLLTFILYILCILVGLSLFIVIFVIIIFTYRKYCHPSSKSSVPMINHQRHRSNRRKNHHRMSMHRNSYIDQDARTEKTMVTTIRQHY